MASCGGVAPSSSRSPGSDRGWPPRGSASRTGGPDRRVTLPSASRCPGRSSRRGWSSPGRGDAERLGLLMVGIGFAWLAQILALSDISWVVTAARRATRRRQGCCGSSPGRASPTRSRSSRTRRAPPSAWRPSPCSRNRCAPVRHEALGDPRRAGGPARRLAPARPGARRRPRARGLRLCCGRARKRPSSGRPPARAADLQASRGPPRGGQRTRPPHCDPTRSNVAASRPVSRRR